MLDQEYYKYSETWNAEDLQMLNERIRKSEPILPISQHLLFLKTSNRAKTFKEIVKIAVELNKECPSKCLMPAYNKEDLTCLDIQKFWGISIKKVKDLSNNYVI